MSRYVRINERFSEGGYSSELKKEFQGYGRAKLAEMLTLPDNLIELMTPDMTRNEIIEVKKEYKEEQETSDIELAIEAAEQEPVEKTEGERILYEYFKMNPEEYKNLPIDPKEVREYLKPDEKRLLICRLPGIGRCVMVLSEAETIPVTSMRGETLPAWTWSGLLDYIAGIAPEGDRKKLWSELYDMPYPEQVKEDETKTKRVAVVKPKENPKVAPVQPKTMENKTESIAEDNENKHPAAEQTEMIAATSHTEEPESVENTEQEPITEESYEERMKALKTASGLKWNEINGCIAMNEYQKAKEHIGELVDIIDQMEKLDNTPLIEEG